MTLKLPIAMSNRHIHLSKEDLEVLFGEAYDLRPLKDLSQPGQYACEELVEIAGPKGSIGKVRVLGPTREKTQVEVSVTDCFKLGVKPVIRESGDLDNSSAISLKGPKGELDLDQGLIVAARHIHMHTEDAEKFGLKDNDLVKIKTDGIRSLIFENVLVRVSENYALEMHVDVEEGNASGIKNGDLVELIK